MKTKQISIVIICALFISVIVLMLIKYNSFVQRSKSTEVVREFLNREANFGLTSISMQIIIYYSNTGIPVENSKQIIDYYNRLNGGSNVQYVEKSLKDPWNEKDESLLIIPVYDKVDSVIIGNAIISCGIDGKMNYDQSKPLLIKDIENGDLFYNKSSYYIANKMPNIPPVEKPTFFDFIFGKKDFIIMYLRYSDFK